jgi:dsDNA-specific endonuclease/ATPase MutS2
MLQKGDKVAIIDDNSEGVILQINADGTIIIEDEDGFEMEYEAKELVKIEVENHLQYEKSLNASRLDKDEIRKKRNPIRHKKDKVEVDLHIEELIDDHRGWTNAEIIEYQLEVFEKVLSSAFQTRKRKMIVIHGRGDGILRFEIRRKLQDYPGIEVYDASYKEYGQGATEILLHK